MTFTSVGYVALFAATAILYFSAPKRLQNAVLLAASAVFYCANLPGAQNADGTPRPLWLRVLPLAVLAANTVFAFYMAKAIAKAQGKRRGRLLFFAIAACVVVLAVFKYTNQFLPTLITLMGGALPLPLGISFYTFAVISYLVDVSNGEMPPEDSLLNWAVFVSFFATITSGPICRAQKLLPQLRQEHRFDAQRSCDAMRLMLWGCFKWVAIANVLGLFVNEVFNAHDSYNGYTGLILPLSAILYVLQLYFEFSGYSEIARGTGMFLGLELPVNFKSPLFSTNFSMLWSRWHISLSSWLQDYIFTPLVWSRWTSRLPLIGKRVKKLPVISSVALVFLISGFWHGSTWCFVFWGVLQAVFRVGEELLHKYYRKPPPRPTLPVRCFKVAVVFTLWTASHVFFRVGIKSGGTVAEGFRFFLHSFQNASWGAFAANFVTAVENGFYTRPIMVAGYCGFVLVVLAIGVFGDWMQMFRLKDQNFSTAIGALPRGRRWVCYYVLIGLVMVGFIMQSGGFGTVSFAYANF